MILVYFMPTSKKKSALKPAAYVFSGWTTGEREPGAGGVRLPALAVLPVAAGAALTHVAARGAGAVHAGRDVLTGVQVADVHAVPPKVPCGDRRTTPARSTSGPARPLPEPGPLWWDIPATRLPPGCSAERCGRGTSEPREMGVRWVSLGKAATRASQAPREVRSPRAEGPGHLWTHGGQGPAGNDCSSSTFRGEH